MHIKSSHLKPTQFYMSTIYHNAVKNRCLSVIFITLYELRVVIVS